jgi:hypothetical protein
MRIYSHILSVIGFLFQYVAPIILFGNVIPYTHESLEAGLTLMAYIAMVFLIVVISRKLKKKLEGMNRCFLKALFLSLIYPVTYWFIAKIGINYLVNLFVALAQYWSYIVIFIIIGGLFHLISGVVYNKGDSDGR